MEVEALNPSPMTRDGKSVERGGAPLAPSSPPPHGSARKQRRRRNRKRCLAAAMAVILGIALLMLILGLTVFKAKRPVTNVNSVALRDLKFSLDITRLQVRLNASLDVDLSIRNPNKVGFRYSNCSALLQYRGDVVGEVPIPAGKISSGQTLPMNLTLTLFADRLLSNSQLYSDVISGTLPLSTYTKVSGKVHILFFRIHVVSQTSCDLAIDVSSRTVANQTCRYKTKL